MGDRIAVGMSGGVDSSVAALLLKRAGFDIVGVTMRLWDDDKGSSEDSIRQAAAVAAFLHIPHFCMDLREDFKKSVINYFTSEYMEGRTPNPCIMCNRFLKWGEMLKNCGGFGASRMATGHYARIVHLKNGRMALKNSAAGLKDQTYALYRLTQNQLSRTLLPLGEYDKQSVRDIAKKAGLPVWQRPESQDICFVPDGDYAAFIENMTRTKPICGNFVSPDGQVLGTHKGITHYTVGQRKKLGVALGRRVFVTAIRPQNNEVVLGDEKCLSSSSLKCHDINYMALDKISSPMRVLAKIRYNHKGAAATIFPADSNGVLEAVFEVPQKAVTPGQSAVFYDNGHIVCGGVIL